MFRNLTQRAALVINIYYISYLLTMKLYHQEPFGRAEAIKMTLWAAKQPFEVVAHPVEEL